jgi:hypothetical protein
VPDISTIVVPDAATTPVNHTFNKVKVAGDSAYFVEQSNASALGYWPLTMSLRAPLPGQVEKLYRSKMNFAMPVVSAEVINGITRPRLEYTLRYNAESVIPAEATLQNRKDLRKLSVGIQNDASWIACVESQLNVT